MKARLIIPFALAALFALPGCGEKKSAGAGGVLELQNVSYDPTREFYEAVNKAFAKKWADDGFPGLPAENRAKHKFDSRGSDTFVKVKWDAGKEWR